MPKLFYFDFFALKYIQISVENYLQKNRTRSYKSDN